MIRNSRKTTTDLCYIFKYQESNDNNPIESIKTRTSVCVRVSLWNVVQINDTALSMFNIYAQKKIESLCIMYASFII